MLTLAFLTRHQKLQGQNIMRRIKTLLFMKYTIRYYGYYSLLLLLYLHYSKSLLRQDP